MRIGIESRAVIKKWITLAVVIVALGLVFMGCAGPAETPPPQEAVSGAEMPSEYAQDVDHMTPEDCAKCHSRFFNLIRNEGGKHRIDCKACHVRFHIYRPGKVEYADVLPKCSACHDMVHGEDLALCSECHTNAHTPMKIPANRALEEGCRVCHAEVDKEMKTYITQHTELNCSSCHHSAHRYVPVCVECHRPHKEGMTQAECLTCHPPHSATQVAYPEDIRQEACAGCHHDAFNKLHQTRTKHTDVPCAKCHPQHRAIVRCRECHSEIHTGRSGLLEQFQTCGRCHGVAHSVVLH